MSIQATINSTLSLASLLATQSPGLKAKAEKRAELKSLGRKEEVLSKAVSESAGDPKIGQELTDKLGEIKKQQFELDPSDKSFQAYRQQHYHTTEGQQERATTFREDPQAVAEELYDELQYKREVAANLEAMMKPQEASVKAQDAVIVAQEQKRKTRRNFLDYMKDEPVSFGKSAGGTIGQLKPELQKEILSQYSKKERKEIMDRKDAMNGKE